MSERRYRPAELDWCIPDNCPSNICGGPHRVVETDLGVELLRDDQTPLGVPIERGADHVG